MQPRYYPLIDPTRFDGTDEEQALRAVGATSALLVDLIVHQTVPVLSQSQVIDSAFVLDAVLDDTTGDAFIGMVADGLIQTRFVADGLERRPGEDPFTVLNAFASRLRSGFQFSAWPALDDPEARDAVYAAVRGTSQQSFEGELGDQLEALRALDLAFRHSRVSEQATPVPARQRLGARVLADLHAQPAAGELRLVGQAVERLARAAGPDDTGRPAVDLDSRSAWRRALRESASTLDVGEEAVRVASEIVDMHYNCVVALSLGAATCLDETASPHVPIGLRHSAAPVEFDRRVTFLLDPGSGADHLTWKVAREQMSVRRFDSPDVRLERLFNQRLVELVDDRRLVKVVAATPRKLLQAAHGGVPGGAAGFVMDERLGLLGAVLGSAFGEAMTPDEFLIGGRAASKWEAMVHDRAVSRLRRSVGVTTEASRR